MNFQQVKIFYQKNNCYRKVLQPKDLSIHHKVGSGTSKLALQKKQYQELDMDHGFDKEDKFNKLRTKNKKVSDLNDESRFNLDKY